MGQTITINCYTNPAPCQEAKLHLYLNQLQQNNLLIINKTTVQLQLHNYTIPFSIVICIATCPDNYSSKTVCGTQFCVGDVPDKPANFMCQIHELSNNMECKWTPGKETHLSTNYTLHLKSLQEIQLFSSNTGLGTIPLNKLPKNQTFSVWVRAENVLGTVVSDQLYIDPKDIVIPATPIMTELNTIDSPVFKTKIQWQKLTAVNNTFCEVRYKEAASKTWHVREWQTDFKRHYWTEYQLDANTKYEFQVRCRLAQTGSYWSQWSNSSTYMTPEAAPSSVLDVWRHLGPVYENGSREVTVLIKPFHPKESRGRILDYSVYWENRGKILNVHNTTETKCKILVPASVTTVNVTARNSKGSSNPAIITVNQQSSNDNEFPCPTNLTAICDEQNGISVMWEPFKPIGKSGLWYIVEWTFGDWPDIYQYDTLWKKVPIHNTTTNIQGDIRAELNINILVYVVYQDGVSRACSVRSFSKEQYTVEMEFLSNKRNLKAINHMCRKCAHTFGAQIICTPCFSKCGENKHMFMNKPQDRRTDIDLKSTSAAIDGKKGQCWGFARNREFLPDQKWERPTSDDISRDYDQENDVGLLLGIGTGVASLSIFVLILIAKKSCRKRVSVVCISVTPKWLFEEYPKVQNSSAIKTLQEKNGSVTHNSTRLFQEYEDVVITEVEETLVDTAMNDDNSDSRDAVHANSLQEVLLVDSSVIVKENGYKPQVSNKILLASAFCSTYNMQSQNWDTNSNPPAPSMNILIKDYTSPMASVWPIADTDENMFSLEKMSLVLNNSRSGISSVISLTDEESSLPMENPWQFPQSDDNTQEQTIIPNELLSCLGAGNEDSTTIITYFPQCIAK